MQARAHAEIKEEAESKALAEFGLQARAHAEKEEAELCSEMEEVTRIRDKLRKETQLLAELQMQTVTSNHAVAKAKSDAQREEAEAEKARAKFQRDTELVAETQAEAFMQMQAFKDEEAVFQGYKQKVHSLRQEMEGQSALAIERAEAMEGEETARSFQLEIKEFQEELAENHRINSELKANKEKGLLGMKAQIMSVITVAK